MILSIAQISPLWENYLAKYFAMNGKKPPPKAVNPAIMKRTLKGASIPAIAREIVEATLETKNMIQNERAKTEPFDIEKFLVGDVLYCAIPYFVGNFSHQKIPTTNFNPFAVCCAFG